MYMYMYVRTNVVSLFDSHQLTDHVAGYGAVYPKYSSNIITILYAILQPAL